MDAKLGDLISPHQELGTLDLEITEDTLCAATTGKTLLKGESSAEFGEMRQALLGRRARISIASPNPNTVSLGFEGDRERLVVPLICTFDPEPGVAFYYARIQGQLSTDGASESVVAEEMFPTEINAPIQVSGNLKLSPKFSFHDIKIEPVELSTKKDYILFEPEILALHVGTHMPAWSLQSTSGKSVIGVKHLFLIVSKPAGKRARMEIGVGGRVQTNLGPLPIAWAKRDTVAKLTVEI